MIQIKTGGKGKPERGFQELMAEALNDLFAKYDVPTISE
jgi:Antitoxin-like ribbon-helix-helix